MLQSALDTVITGLRLPFHFDPDRLKGDLNLIPPEQWVPHYNERDYGGEWRGVALRSSTGEAGQLTALPARENGFTDTPVLEQCTYLASVLTAFHCRLRSVRLLSLAPRSFIREHSDHALGYEDGEIRIHIPIQTNPGVEFYLAGECLKLEEGNAYYLNVNLPHRVNNSGNQERIHLVIDAEVNEWVHALFAEGMARDWSIPRCDLSANTFDQFRDLVFNDTTLLQMLHSIPSRSELVHSTVQAGRKRGFGFTPGDVEARFVNVSYQDQPHCLDDWLPIRVHFVDSRPFVDWAYFRDKRLTEPFFEDSVRSCLQNPFAALFRRRSPLQDVRQDLAPSGFIFHMSRCGSTLVSQILASLSRTVVVSEAPPIDQVIQAHLRVPGLSQMEHVNWLRWIVAALGQRRSGVETHYFVKLDAWHIHSLPLIRASFPETPWLYLFRNREEVIASHLCAPGVHCLPGAMEDPRILGLTQADVTALPREEWCSRVIARIHESALSFRDDPRGLFVNYNDLPGVVWGPLSRHFNMTFREGELEQMRARARLHSKTSLPYKVEKNPAIVHSSLRNC